MGRRAELVEDRLWRHVKRFANDKGCHLWEGAKNRRGQGVIVRSTIEGGGVILAHRLSFELANGPAPEDKDVSQVCGEMACVRPDHLDVLDLPVGNRYANARKESCPKGHLYDAANTYWYRGSRSCRTCRGMKPMVES